MGGPWGADSICEVWSGKKQLNVTSSAVESFKKLKARSLDTPKFTNLQNRSREFRMF